MLTDKLPIARQVLAWLNIVCATLNTAFSAWLIGYQVFRTDGYQRPVPAIIATSWIAIWFPLFFIYSNPFKTSKPWTTKVALFSRSIAFELIVVGALGAMMLVCVADLHSDTPGLLSTCGGYLICRLLTAVLALSWLCILFLGLSFTTLLVSLLYFTLKRKRAIPAFQTCFSEVNWSEYSLRKRGNNVIPLRVSPNNSPNMNEEIKEDVRGSLDQVFVVVGNGEEREKGLHERKRSRDVDQVVQL